MGNQALAWGLMTAAHLSDKEVFLGSYPITPASDILHELSKYKNFGVRTFQAEDEIAAICSSIGAAFGGAMAVTTTSGPGIALKGEAMGLAMMLELPMIDHQRPTWRSQYWTADENRAVRLVSGHVWPQRRMPDARHGCPQPQPTVLTSPLKLGGSQRDL